MSYNPINNLKESVRVIMFSYATSVSTSLQYSISCTAKAQKQNAELSRGSFRLEDLHSLHSPSRLALAVTVFDRLESVIAKIIATVTTTETATRRIPFLALELIPAMFQLVCCTKIKRGRSNSRVAMHEVPSTQFRKKR